jgi:hypothetical protein
LGASPVDSLQGEDEGSEAELVAVLAGRGEAGNGGDGERLSLGFARALLREEEREERGVLGFAPAAAVGFIAGQGAAGGILAAGAIDGSAGARQLCLCLSKKTS